MGILFILITKIFDSLTESASEAEVCFPQPNPRFSFRICNTLHSQKNVRVKLYMIFYKLLLFTQQYVLSISMQ